MTKQTEILLKKETKTEVIEVMNFLNELTADEKQKMLAFIQGARFVKGLEREGIHGAAQTV